MNGTRWHRRRRIRCAVACIGMQPSRAWRREWWRRRRHGRAGAIGGVHPSPRAPAQARGRGAWLTDRRESPALPPAAPALRYPPCTACRRPDLALGDASTVHSDGPRTAHGRVDHRCGAAGRLLSPPCLLSLSASPRTPFPGLPCASSLVPATCRALHVCVCMQYVADQAHVEPDGVVGDQVPENGTCSVMETGTCCSSRDRACVERGCARVL